MSMYAPEKTSRFWTSCGWSANRRVHRFNHPRLFKAGWHAAQAHEHRQDPRARLVARIELRSGVASTYAWFVSHHAALAGELESS